MNAAERQYYEALMRATRMNSHQQDMEDWRRRAEVRQQQVNVYDFILNQVDQVEQSFKLFNPDWDTIGMSGCVTYSYIKKNLDQARRSVKQLKRAATDR